MALSAAAAALIKKAAIMGLVCTTVSTATFVAHEPIKKTVNKVFKKSKAMPHKGVTAPQVSVPDCNQVMTPFIMNNPILISDQPLETNLPILSTGPVEPHTALPPSLVGVIPILPETSPAPVPEPNSWAIMLTGFGILGSAIRFHRKDEVNV